MAGACVLENRTDLAQMASKTLDQTRALINAPPGASGDSDSIARSVEVALAAAPTHSE